MVLTVRSSSCSAASLMVIFTEASLLQSAIRPSLQPAMPPVMRFPSTVPRTLQPRIVP